MKTKLLFNCVPPALVTMPSAAFSVLKTFLKSHQVESEIYYWNLKLVKLQKDFLWAENNIALDQEVNSMLLFFNYLAVKMNDQPTYNKIKGRLMMIKPQFVGRESDLFDKHMSSFADQLDKMIDDIIDEIYSPDISYYGFSANLYQWVVSSIIAAKIKAKNPNSVILLGGLGNKDTAVKFMENFSQFDFALWGEGENALYSLICELDSHANQFDTVPNLVYREDGEIVLSTNRKVEFANLSCVNVRPDYSEYFDQINKCKDVAKIDCNILIEGSRGCHWNKCHFCFLNTGYKNRIKTVEQLMAEIQYNMDAFHVYTFCFLDNDIINNDYNRFEELLDKLIELKLENPDFKIRLAEIITQGIHNKIIKKMVLAGFESVQIGYESPSDKLLKKIEKKNSFATNFLFLKFASIYKIRVGGANVIRGLLEETEDDILEGISNLHVLRFIFRYNYFQHNISALAVNRASRYYKQFPEVKEWGRSCLFDNFLPSLYLPVGDDGVDIIDVMCSDINPLWETFQCVEAYYLKNYFTYQLISNENLVVFKEYFNDTLINELALERDSLEWFILQKANFSVISYDTLCANVKSEFANKKITEIDIVATIDDLKEEKLIYASDDRTEIVSIIDASSLM